jgi:hypothetical protein
MKNSKSKIAPKVLKNILVILRNMWLSSKDKSKNGGA